MARLQLSASKIMREDQFARLEREVKREKNLSLLSGRNQKFVLDYYLFSVAYMTGLRVSELTALTWADVAKDHVIVRRGKGGKRRSVIFGERTNLLFNEFRNVQVRLGGVEISPDSRVFIGQRGPIGRNGCHERIKYWVSRLSLPGSLSIHSFRHGYATRLLDQGIDVMRVAEQMGHSDVKITMSYIHFTSSSMSKLAAVL